MECVNDPAHKAVFVVDRGPKFARFSEIELQVSYKDANSKQKRAGFSPKTLWNCALDAANEFQRILTDCYPNGSHIVRYAVAEGNGQYVLYKWLPVALEEDEYVQAFYEKGYEAVNPELDQSSCSIMSGIELSIDGFTKPSPQQLQYLNSLSLVEFNSASLEHRFHNLTDGVQVVETFQEIEPGTFANGQYVDNKCTMFIITSFDDPRENLTYLSETTLQFFIAKNRIICEMDKTFNHVLAIGGLRVFVLNLVEDDSNVVTTMSSNPSIDVEFIMYNVSPKNLISYLHRVMLEAYNLASTTIMGIPMKEETDPTKSTDYDVEIFHPRALHSQIMLNNLDKTNSKTLSCGYQTICLKWCNPVQKLRKDAFAVRRSCDYCTPVDILSRPTMCVIEFMKKGRHIWLEAVFNSENIMPNMSEKLVTHILSFDVERQGMTLTAIAYGHEAGAYEQKLQELIEDFGCHKYDNVESLNIPLSFTDLDKTDEEKPIVIVRREEHTYVDEDDQLFGVFPRCFHVGSEEDRAQTHNELFEKMKKFAEVVYRRFGFEPYDTTLSGSYEFLEVKKTLRDDMTVCGRATHSWVRYIMKQLFADEVVFRDWFPRHYCMMYHGLVWLKNDQPGLFQIYFDKIYECFEQYGVRYRVHEVLHPPSLNIKEISADDSVIPGKLIPYCFMSAEHKFNLYQNSVLIEHPLMITTNNASYHHEKDRDEPPAKRIKNGDDEKTNGSEKLDSDKSEGDNID